MKRLFVSIILIFILLTSGLVRGEAENPEILLSATAIRLGDFITVTVKTRPDATVTLSFLGETKPLIRSGENHLGLLAVSYHQAPGEYPLRFDIFDQQSTYAKEFQVKVMPRSFPEQRISIPETKRKEILKPGNQESDALTTETARRQAQLEQLPPLWKDTFIWPVQGRITTEFGFIRFVNNIGNGRHSGLDIAAPTGTPVLSGNWGRVIFAGNLHQTGLTVIVHHGLDLFSSYSHLSAITVKAGAAVARGELIGKVGSTGLSTGPHLHLTFRIGETAIDPHLLLEKTL